MGDVSRYKGKELLASKEAEGGGKRSGVEEAEGRLRKDGRKSPKTVPKEPLEIRGGNHALSPAESCMPRAK